jgi:hypothetical protein
VEVLGIKPHEQEDKVIYSLKLECQNSSYICIAQNKTKTSGIDLLIEGNKEIKVNLEMSQSSTMERTRLRLCSCGNKGP